MLPILFTKLMVLIKLLKIAYQKSNLYLLAKISRFMKNLMLIHPNKHCCLQNRQPKMLQTQRKKMTKFHKESNLIKQIIPGIIHIPLLILKASYLI